MRWTYILPRMVFVLMLWAFMRWGFDPLLRYSAVSSIQSVTGAKADIGVVATKFYPPRLQIQQVAVANPQKVGKNLLSFEELELNLAGPPLLRRQFVIEEGRVSGVRFYSPRSDDGRLEGSETEASNEEPSWITEKLQSAGEEWLENLTEQAKAEIDPNVLETYRLGQELYTKWDGRFAEMKDRVNLLKPRVKELKTQFENAKQGDTIQQIEQYVQVAQRAEQLALDARTLKEDVQAIVPEVRVDFDEVNAARVRDQEMVLHKLQLLKPDKRRISEMLVGRQMYRQLVELMTWVETLREYQRDLRQQTKPERGRGTDFSFALTEPTPDFVLAKLLVTGEFSENGEVIPFEAQITDVTDNAPLLGRPCIVRLKTQGSQPLLLQVTYDARTELPVISLAAEYSDLDGYPIRVGKDDKAKISGRLSGVRWNLDLQLAGNALTGRMDLHSSLMDQAFTLKEGLRPEFAMAANRALSQIRDVNATVVVSGTVDKPELDLHSDVGEQLADGMETAVRMQLEETRTKLMADVNAWSTDQVAKLTSRFSTEYDQLVAEHEQIIRQVEGIRTVVASLQSGKPDAKAVFRQVRDSNLIPEKQSQEVDKALRGLNNVNRLIPKPAKSIR